MNNSVQVPDRTKTLIQRYGVLEQLHRVLDQGRTELEQAIGNSICIEDCGKCCQVSTPVVLDTEVHWIVSTKAFLSGVRKTLVERSLDWLTHKHPGAITYGRIQGQPKTEEEKKLLAFEANYLANKQCPYLSDNNQCLIYGYHPLACRRYGVTTPPDEWCPRKRHWTEGPSKCMIIGSDSKLGQEILTLSQKLCVTANGVTGHYTGFLPTMIARELAPERLRDLTVADAKLAVGKPNIDLFYYARKFLHA